MKTYPDRHARKDLHWSSRWASRLGPIALAALAALVVAVPATASPGGAAATTAFAPGATDIAFSPMRVAGATWYGPTLYGNHTACGQVLRPSTVGVAHRTLPCGTAVKFVYHGRVLITRVIDRGPYSRGNAWDLTNGARVALGFEGVDRVRYAVASRYARTAAPH